ncbi:AraC family transcriptional regulator [Serratia nevei]|uniref:AraC family transcriptional regulator n=1 Tax=Serratia nevei TaxID=2703794 RepID=UPI002855B577|nr:AraC family transcriptional regulator [Serratia nevei]MDR8492142.1 AraC family transcriptional regulator [Serratia nevei]
MEFKKPFSKKIITEVFNIIEEKIEAQNNVLIKELASISGYSIGHFQRVFNFYTGMKAGAYIRRRRLSRAALLLKLSDMKIYEISIHAGFSSQQSFSRAFLKQFRSPPNVFRAANDWPFINYQPKIASNNKDFPFDIIHVNLNDLIGVSTHFIFPEIKRGQVKVNYKGTVEGRYDCVRRYVDVSRCNFKINESEFISLIYGGVLPALKVVVTDNIIVKINGWCIDNKSNREHYLIPIR